MGDGIAIYTNHKYRDHVYFIEKCVLREDHLLLFDGSSEYFFPSVKHGKGIRFRSKYDDGSHNVWDAFVILVNKDYKTLYSE